MIQYNAWYYICMLGCKKTLDLPAAKSLSASKIQPIVLVGISASLRVSILCLIGDMISLAWQKQSVELGIIKNLMTSCTLRVQPPGRFPTGGNFRP